jgi:nucleotide-binding universal stress UspA family protein
MRILIPVDGSQNSQRAVEFVLKLVHRDAPPEIHLIHVMPPVEAWEVRRFLTADEITTLQQRDGEEKLRACRALLDAAGIAYRPQVLVGDGQVAEAIARYADKYDCDLIIMGAHGRTGLKHILMGSVASDVIHLAKVPVTLVK